MRFLMNSMVLVLLVLESVGCSNRKTTAAVDQADRAKKLASDSPLINSKTLWESLNHPNIKVLDVSQNREQYDKGHIPGARFVHWVVDITDSNKPQRYNIPDQASMEKLLRRLGIEEDSAIVVYDDLSSRLSTRLYWTLKHYGHRDVYILDGGRALWKSNKYPFSTESVATISTNYKIRQIDHKLRIDIAGVTKQLTQEDACLIDGRPVKQYTGEEPGKVFHTGKTHQNRGHIPGSVSVFWKDNFNADGTFKSKKELQKLYAHAGVEPQHVVTTYCNEGLHAAPPWFVLRELLGYKDVRVYDDSMSEWANSDQPIETGVAEVKNASQPK